PALSVPVMVAEMHVRVLWSVVSVSVVLPAFAATAPPGCTVQVCAVAAAGDLAPAPTASTIVTARAATPTRVRTGASPPTEPTTPIRPSAGAAVKQDAAGRGHREGLVLPLQWSW